MNISLTNQLSQYVDEKVTSGLYNSASEVMREALRLMKQQDLFQEAKIQALRRDIQAGLGSGESTLFDLEDIKREAKKRFEKKIR